MCWATIVLEWEARLKTFNELENVILKECEFVTILKLFLYGTKDAR
jgi:hypothetical protein